MQIPWIIPLPVTFPISTPLVLSSPILLFDLFFCIPFPHIAPSLFSFIHTVCLCNTHFCLSGLPSFYSFNISRPKPFFLLSLHLLSCFSHLLCPFVSSHFSLDQFHSSNFPLHYLLLIIFILFSLTYYWQWYFIFVWKQHWFSSACEVEPSSPPLSSPVLPVSILHS